MKLYLVQTCVFCACLAALPLRAVTVYYDTVPTTSALDGGSGNWSDAYWKSSSTGTSGSTWVSGNSAYFYSTTPTTVDLGGATVSATELKSVNVYTSNGVTLNNGTLNLNSLYAWDYFYNNLTAINLGAGGANLDRMTIANSSLGTINLTADQAWYMTRGYDLGNEGTVNTQGHTLTLDINGRRFFNSDLVGSGDLVWNGNTRTHFGGDNSSWTGDLTIGKDATGTELCIYNPLALSANNVVNFLAGDGAERHLILRGNSITVGGLSGGDSNEAVSNNAADHRNESPAAVTLTINTSGNYTFGGQIRDDFPARNGGAVSVIKTGAGRQTISGASLYSGTTTVNQGTLLVNGTHTGGGTYTVNSGGTLGGQGIIYAPVTVASGGFFAPGNSPGTITVDDLTLQTGATHLIDGADLTIVNNSLTLQNDWILKLSGGYFADGGSTVLFTYGSQGASFDLTPIIDISGLNFTPSGALTLTDDGSTITLNGITGLLIPEPATLLNLMSGSLIILGLRWYRGRLQQERRFLDRFRA